MASSSRDGRSTLSFFVLSLVSFLILALYISNGREGSVVPAKASHLKSRAETAVPESSPSSFPTSSPAGRNSSLSSSSEDVAPFGFAVRLAADEDDPYTCGPGRPCSNGACCGPSGNCGYAPAYCGAGCTSNCDAKAECGQYAANPGQTCKLNACCSEHGFCGTTKDFCQEGCQSNCILEPKPPGGSPKGAALDRVIGYYESWSYKSPCNRKAPSDLPLKDLTHLNYAFTFIEPETYEMVTMDMEHEDDLWQITVDSKKYNPNLKVYVAVGGWTFSDNGTVTQPLFGEIARTEANRKKFADGVVRFLNRYGFDGLDIDWEYPGAGDRGGKDEDVPNFVLLMKTLRAAFDASPRQLGLTFTIPSSFWYLRWFDMPGLLQYADWTNLMSYDLHGTWDEHNPIGAIAQAHTNLTEIKLAAQLLWRVGVRPEQVVLGYGFYGRAFELADPSCSKPGCPFAGGAKKGPCSNEAGILMYYEIQAILKKYPDLKPVFDKEAAVKYITWDKNQWISYDDAETFELKLKWANDMGFGGSMIWAVDTDDDKFSAMSGLLGYQVAHLDTSKVEALEMTDSNLVETVKLENGQGCYVHKEFGCAELVDMKCPKGEEMVAYDRNGCGSEDGTKGVPVCCPTGSTSKKCIWRGTPKDGGIWGDCNGQCHAGESKVAGSSWGGGNSADDNWPLKKCARGGKVLCCEANDWKDLIDGCSWTTCVSGQTIIDTKTPADDPLAYCCPRDTGLYECKWRGSSPDCVDANCKATEDGKDIFEVQVDAHAGGGSWNLCNYDRKRALCCQLRVALPEPLTCTVNTCSLDPLSCSQSNRDEWGNQPGVEETGLEKRSLVAKRGETGLVVRQDDLDEGAWELLDKRTYKWVTSFGLVVIQYSLTYPQPAGLMRRLREGLNNILLYWRTRSENCGDPGVQALDIDVNGAPPPRCQVEHTLPLVIVSRFASVAEHGRMWAARPAGSVNETTGRTRGQAHPRGRFTTAPAAGNRNFWSNIWNNPNGLPANLPPVTRGGPDFRRPEDRLYEALGSNTNPRHFTFLQDNINAIKGRVEIFNAPMARRPFTRFLREALDRTNDSPMTDIMAFMAPLRELVGLYEYLRASDVVSSIDAGAAAILGQLQIMELNVADARGLTMQWNEFYPDYFRLVGDFARGWARARIAEVRREYGSRPNAVHRDEVLRALKGIEDDIPNWKHPAE
ncbi:chitinase [Colletotrichum sojae]|uniref:chitinase n=1 Tax=Colletotrichum sojae TaxID=2175907 RepID=A0A8H6IPK0_9PEZI|nr:chitinase [Colletotrichum sojae]